MNHFVLGLAFIASAPAAKEAPAKEPPSLLGEWEAESGIRSGKPATLIGLGFGFAADGRFIWKEAARESEAKYTIDAKKVPPEIDIEFTVPGGTRKLHGIYKLDGKFFIVCLVPGGAERPKKLESPAGAGSMLINFKRAPKD